MRGPLTANDRSPNIVLVGGTSSFVIFDDDLRPVPICLHCLKCTKFGQLIIMKICTIVATRCHILRLKWTKLISAGTPPHIPLAAGGAHSAPRNLTDTPNSKSWKIPCCTSRVTLPQRNEKMSHTFNIRDI